MKDMFVVGRDSHEGENKKRRKQSQNLCLSSQFLLNFNSRLNDKQKQD